MDYLEKFQSLMKEEQYSSFISIWDEFCLNDVVNGDEVVKVLELVKGSPLADVFGQVVDTVLPLWESVPDGIVKDKILRLVLDLQVDNSKIFFDLAFNFLQARYGTDEFFQDSLKLIGLREGGVFRGAISNYELLNHMKPGCFVLHLRGWGVGEVMDASFTQKRALIEFEGFPSLKDVSFESGFKNLIPLDKGHFLARRFGDPDSLESLAKQDPIQVIIMIIKDLGPKNSSEIKNELLDLVIPDLEWNKWWQATRSKLKKDARVVYPDNLKNPFILRSNGVSRFEQLKNEISRSDNVKNKIIEIYNFLRDFPQELKNEDRKKALIEILENIISDSAVDSVDAIQSKLILNDYLSVSKEESIKEFVCSLKVEEVIDELYILGLKRSFLGFIKKYSSGWGEMFLRLFLKNNSSNIRDYLFKELKSHLDMEPILKQIVSELPEKATYYPEAFIWMLQKLSLKDDGIFPLSDLQIRRNFLEASFVLLHFLSRNPHQREYSKKLYQLLIGKRYLLIREFIESSSIEFLKELILLSTKCPQFSGEDLSVLQSLSQVIQPGLKVSNNPREEEDIFWTTQTSYCRMREKLQTLIGKETIDNAKEIEHARALGDLKENSEYKFALEKRARIQGEIKNLSEELGKARILTCNDIDTSKVGIGSVVDLQGDSGELVRYTILGSWEADPENNILSLKSKLASQMCGLKEGESFEFKGKKFTVKKITVSNI